MFFFGVSPSTLKKKNKKKCLFSFTFLDALKKEKPFSEVVSPVGLLSLSLSPALALSSGKPQTKDTSSRAMPSCRGASAPPRRGGRSSATTMTTTTLKAPSARLVMSRRASAPAEGSGGGLRQRAPAAGSGSVNNATSSSSAAAAPSTSPALSEQKPFSWTSHWFPVAVEADLPRDRPVPIKLLGRRLVLWWASAEGGEGRGGAAGEGEEEGRWSCLDDACSHRLAPLSEGRIDTSCVPCTGDETRPSCRALACSYHGFAFDGAGRAVAVPQARHDGGAEAERRAAGSPRARVRSHPTLALDQLVWVWGGAGGDEAAKEAAEAPPPPGPPEEIRRLMLEAEAAPQGRPADAPPPPLVALITNQQYFRDLPVPYDEMMTNLADQSHVPFAVGKVGVFLASSRFFSRDLLSPLFPLSLSLFSLSKNVAHRRRLQP